MPEEACLGILVRKGDIQAAGTSWGLRSRQKGHQCRDAGS